MGEYSQSLTSGASLGTANLQELVTQLKQRYERFYNDPAHHRSRVAIDLVRDYWDLAAAVGAGIAFSHPDNQILGYNGQTIAGVAGIASLLGSISGDYRLILPRLLRNFAGASGGLFAESGVSIAEEAGYVGGKFLNYVESYFASTYFFGTPTVIFEGFRRLEKSAQQQKKLETLAQQSK